MNSLLDKEKEKEVDRFEEMVPMPHRPMQLQRAPCPAQEITLAWCSIFYYELKNRVGEVFLSYSQTLSITIDGFTNPDYSGDRLSLGSFSSAAWWNSIVESTRRHIGKGVHLYYSSGDVFAECLSKSSIFIQSMNANTTNRFPTKTVYRLTNGCSLKIFDSQQFALQLKEAIHHGYQAVYTLTEQCNIRISFVKGWGVDSHYTAITSMPCWIEVHLHDPLRWLDCVLIKIGSPRSPIGSMS